MEIIKRLSEIQRNLKVKKEKYNSFGKYHYRDAELILESIKHLLKEDECILCDSQIIFMNNRFYVEITAKFQKGNENISTKGYAREEEDKKGMDGSQITGASTSYAKKYALCNLFGIDNSEEDPDSKNNTDTKTISNKKDHKEVKIDNSKLFEDVKQSLLNSKDIKDLGYNFATIYKRKNDFTNEQMQEIINIKDNLKSNFQIEIDERNAIQNENK
jgi:hypothetical protein